MSFSENGYQPVKSSPRAFFRDVLASGSFRGFYDAGTNGWRRRAFERMIRKHPPLDFHPNG
jgi:hypothetical protein